VEWEGGSRGSWFLVLGFFPAARGEDKAADVCEIS
jgi:hypothetical protein